MKDHQPQSTSTSKISESYDEHYKNHDNLHESVSFYQWVLDKIVVSTHHKALLDIACGGGYLVKYAQERGILSLGIDISHFALCKASEFNNGVSFFSQADGQFLPFPDNSFDYITNLGSLEHFKDPIKGVQEMKRTLKPGGKAAVFLPNEYYLADIFWHVWRTGYPVSHSQSLERFATYNEWRDMLEAGGLKVQKGYKYNRLIPRSKGDWNWYFQNLNRFLYLATAPIIPFNLSYSFLYICSC